MLTSQTGQRRVAAGNVARVFRRRGLLVGLRVENSTVQVLDRPTIAHELNCEPIEQFRMRGSTTAVAKVVWRRDQSGTKVPLPDSIHQDASSPWVFRRDDPIRQSQASACGIGSGWLDGRILRLEHGRKAGGNFFAGRLVIALIENVDGRGGRPFVGRTHRHPGFPLLSLPGDDHLF